MARPTLPRIRRGRARGEAGQVVERTEPRIAELSANGLTWIHINEPGPLEAAYIAERFGFHELDIEDVLSKRQRPKIDEYPDYLFIVLHFPIYDKSVQRLNAAELDVFLGQDFLITLANVELLPVTYLFRRCEEDASFATSSSRRRRATCSTTSSTTSSTTASRSSTRSGTSWTRSRTSSRSGAARRSSATSPTRSRRSSRTARSSSPSARLCACSSATRSASCPHDLELYFDDIVDAAERIWDLLDNYKEVVEALEDTNESIISHRQQYRLQLLTVVSVILLPLTLIASVFGMNVARARRGRRDAFWIVVGLMVVLGLALLGVFRWRRWL